MSQLPRPRTEGEAGHLTDHDELHRLHNVLDGSTKTADAAQAAAIAASQPVDSDLTAIAALTTTAYGRAFLALADAAAGRTALGLGTAATAATGDFDAAGAAAAAQAASQPLDSDLTALAALTTTAYGRSVLEAANAAALRTLAGLGNVDNTSDANKPVSTAQQAALDAKGVRVEDEGVSTVAAATGINFAGAGVSVTDAGSNEALVTISGGGAGGPADADYLVGTANGGLSAEIVVGTSPGGELGGTWASPTVDATHSGSSHADHITKAILDANTVLYATVDDTPAALVVPASRVVGRQSTGNIIALTADQLQTLLDAATTAYAREQIDVYATPGAYTWTKPTWAKTVEVYVLAGGGSGGSGRKGAAGTARCGGGGGGGGGFSSAVFKASDLSATVSLTVAGSASIHGGVLADSTSGTAGGDGNDSFFGATAASCLVGATGGGGGGGGGNGVAGAAGAAGFGSSAPSAGAASSNAGNVGTGGAAALAASSGGGAGGGLTTGNTRNNGGSGGLVRVFQGAAGPLGGLTDGADGTDATTNSTNGPIPGHGGGGGAAGSAGNGGPGGDGIHGGGGGGGGAATDGVGNSGASGKGSAGLIVVISHG